MDYFLRRLDLPIERQPQQMLMKWKEMADRFASCQGAGVLATFLFLCFFFAGAHGIQLSLVLSTHVREGLNDREVKKALSPHVVASWTRKSWQSSPGLRLQGGQITHPSPLSPVDLRTHANRLPRGSG